jgi:putative tryptophan/tyrosine transport system permease protein
MGLIMAWAVISLALSFRLLDFPDLTIEGSILLGAAVFAVMRKQNISLIPSIVCALVGGGLAGALTGFLHVRFKINKFLAGIIVIAISYSLSLRIMGSSNIGMLREKSLFDLAEPLNRLVPGLHFGTYVVLTVLVSITACLVLYGLSTRRGVRLRVAGSNPVYARSLGINSPANIVAGLAITNSLAAFSGTLLAMHQGFVDIGIGQGVLILALAAMTIGERLLPERRLPFPRFVFFAAVTGSIVYQVLVAYAVRLGLAPTDLKLATAVMVIAVIALRVSRDDSLLSGVGS